MTTFGSDPWDFGPIREALKPFDSTAVITAIAGLQAHPANAHSLWRLSVLATLACEIQPGKGDMQLTGADLNTLLNESSLATVAASHEDPLDGPLTEEVAFYSGSSLAGEGLGESTDYAFRHLARGCLRTDGIPPDLRTELIFCAAAALAISDSALRAAGLGPNMAPPEERGRIEIPEQRRLIALQKAMAFDSDRLGRLFPAAGREALEPLILEVGKHSFTDQEAVEGSGDRRPLVRAGKWLILARPFDVLAALRHHISMRVSTECGPGVTQSLFGESVDADVVLSLKRLMLNPSLEQRRSKERPFSEIKARIDVDKVLLALVIVDDFENLSENHPYTIWNGVSHIEDLAKRFEEFGGEAKSEGDEVLGLILSQPAGRQGLMPAPTRGFDNVLPLGLTAADLETIAVLEAGDQLALWKFAQAENGLHNHAKVTTSSMLDVYGMYRDKERSFGEQRNFNLISILPGFAGPCRVRACAGRDRHAELDVGGEVREVERQGIDDPRERLYFETEISGGRALINIGRSSPALWVAGPERDISRTLDAVETVAYWLAEVREPLASFFEQLSLSVDAVRIEVDFDPWGYWFEGADDPGTEDPGSVTIVDSRTAKVTAGASIRRLLPRFDNSGERKLVNLLLEALGQLSEATGEAGMMEEERAAAVEAVAPLGIKKHLIMLPAELNPMIEEADGPPRLVQEADRSAVRYALADHLGESFGYKDEQVPHERRNEVLRAAVAFLFGEASAGLDISTSEGLLESLITQNERLTAESEHRRAILPAKLATYPAAAESLREEVTEANLAGICCRFLIEYATAAAPRGEASWGLARFDRGLATVAEMLSWADLSDAVHGELSDVDLIVREDGMLRLAESDRYDSGRGQYFDLYLDSQRRTSQERWQGRFEPREATESELTQRLDQLMVEEAGVSLTRIGETLVAANHLARNRDENVVVMDRGDACKELAEMLTRPHEEIEKAVTYLEMGPRDDFMKPPNGTKNDVYPWLFARRWSYNRRPFLRREIDDSEQLLWGRRHVLAALNILTGQLGSGKYQHLASAPALRRELGKMAKEEGAEFEREVADAFRARGYPVERGVKHLGGDKLRRAKGEDLGDIDVLAADPNRKLIWAVECKGLAGSLSSSEVVIEMTGHFGQKGVTSVTKHRERVDWLKQRLNSAQELLEVEDGEDWEAKGLIVTGRDAIAPFIDDLPFDLVSLDRLDAYLQTNSAHV